ncbi:MULTISPECIES: exodeoxyribonuclease VII large subunit [Acidithiobacillus]|jgi:exodeoxyribonuclease VII large subunit|uniref:Exodeoxyribonuclease 7 large subunit n=6 Tax=Acidithiobacillus caldus TaxID=33059 RepID=F9ZKZ9_ACICS|nr:MULTISPECIES: exodeoxyribonuclease VII large subunit [Acidithiobacillus]AEK57526.1 Exodeoxyribonuclease VII large subunit [Acidithiobacillus caldus SM-1]AIA54735.1 Exodeoxyribonuclease VII large subunit [Acidithiobacillus caldus ATCC 51756]AUW32234.1 exodeoxyribonuclease VII large subunit [Acidithiobacillus caldus]MBU2731082.1 exodeoxyribonuclease VII large subunit [Acidithiobacillus caldus]MBU2735065.1 exodeoxyribonuclease VII large subunit [Acidithiobacillus caldus ATCC 51756]
MTNEAEIPALSVSELNRSVREILEGNFPLLRVTGEISNFVQPASGHWYFSLKDDRAQVRCAMFRARNALCRLRPKDGLQVQVLAQPTLYEGRGDFQLLIESLTAVGAGDLQARFAALKEKLAAEGLFAPELKRPLPAWPRRVAVISSASGAALHDIRVTLARRWPVLEIVVYPVLVQGDQAAAQICAALQRAGQRAQEDLVILARGGGSAEDLWCFNEESVARAIRACPLPVVTGIGHEIDFTIADFAADLRAPTPTAAAEAASPDGIEIRDRIEKLKQQLTRAMVRRLREETQRLDHLRLRLRDPRQALDHGQHRLAGLQQRLRQAVRRRLWEARERLANLDRRRRSHHPQHLLLQGERNLLNQRKALERAMGLRLEHQQQRLQQLRNALQLLNPEAVLQRGFSILRDGDGQIVRDSRSVGLGAELDATLARGRLRLQVRGRSPE